MLMNSGILNVLKIISRAFSAEGWQDLPCEQTFLKLPRSRLEVLLSIQVKELTTHSSRQICTDIQVTDCLLSESENSQQSTLRDKLVPLTACPGRARGQGSVLLGGGHSDQEYGCS